MFIFVYVYQRKQSAKQLLSIFIIISIIILKMRENCCNEL